MKTCFIILIFVSVSGIFSCKTATNKGESRIMDSSTPANSSNNTASNEKFTPVPIAQAVELIDFKDVTEQFTYNFTPISAFPDAYNIEDYKENSDIFKIFHFTAKSSTSGLHEVTGRIEAFYTGDDWGYPYVYFITDAPQEFPRNDPICEGKVIRENPTCNLWETRTYLITEFSTTAESEGEAQPKFDYQNENLVIKYIKEKFLVKDGLVNTEFRPILKAKPQQ